MNLPRGKNQVMICRGNTEARRDIFFGEFCIFLNMNCDNWQTSEHNAEVGICRICIGNQLITLALTNSIAAVVIIVFVLLIRRHWAKNKIKKAAMNMSGSISVEDKKNE